VCIAENCTATMHNVYTLRGAQIRDALAWSKYLDEALLLFGDCDTLFMSHHWPRWGRERIADYIERQRDSYRYLHDQTLRLANHGYTKEEIAEMLELPAELAATFSCRGYYGTVRHNVKAVFQRYLGWFDGNPANLDPLPQVEAGTRYVAAMGGADAVLAEGRRAIGEGDYRWAAEVLNHLVFADPDNAEARQLQAAALEQLGYQAESGIWRGFYLSGAQELRDGVQHTQMGSVRRGGGVIDALPLAMFLDSLAIRLNGPAADGKTAVMNMAISDTGEQRAVTLRRGVLHHRDGFVDAADVTLRLTRAALTAIAVRPEAFGEKLAEGEIEIDGDAEALLTIFGSIDTFHLAFPIVTPRS
jgi:alkyl sulfatase BDS1-like metallo-beta-lactamase superfamily hydrolase